jgi:aspartate/methionine/tyrosine aminotransferase
MMIDLSETNQSGIELAMNLLTEEKVAVAPGVTFGESAKSMVRVSLATEETQLLEGIERICTFVERYREQLPARQAVSK